MVDSLHDCGTHNRGVRVGASFRAFLIGEGEVSLAESYSVSIPT